MELMSKTRIEKDRHLYLLHVPNIQYLPHVGMYYIIEGGVGSFMSLTRLRLYTLATPCSSSFYFTKSQQVCSFYDAY